ncbi:hypothetical protein IAG41_22530 [Sphingomonas sp. JC676]|uniref:hypothetical protein n=1 Tax=Sphingomonas sp. JC676 TaxID=2768065 RepID=UPI001657A793|nr:hypothetical protein [Sphingomonas sp. JC676]MBC9035176.1 hypothetical protein [Sphingomonas sp. JC676]
MFRYPDGVAGVALLLLRCSDALIAFPLIARLPSHFLIAGGGLIISILIAFALSAGLATRAAALCLAMAAGIDIALANENLGLLVIAHIGGCTALALLGPGAYSIDAKLFGRRVIRLDPRAPDRGSRS